MQILQSYRYEFIPCLPLPMTTISSNKPKVTETLHCSFPCFLCHNLCFLTQYLIYCIRENSTWYNLQIWVCIGLLHCQHTFYLAMNLFQSEWKGNCVSLSVCLPNVPLLVPIQFAFKLLPLSFIHHVFLATYRISQILSMYAQGT